MKPGFLLLDAGPLAAIASGNPLTGPAARRVRDAWLRDCCHYCPLSLFDILERKEDWRLSPGWGGLDALRERLIAAGMREISIGWETLRESAAYSELPAMSREWLLLGVATWLDALLVTDRKSLLDRDDVKHRVIAWPSADTIASHS